MKEKVKNRLRELFPKANLSKQRLDTIVAGLSKKVTEETTPEELDGVINDYNEVFNFEEIARQDDRIRTLSSRQDQDQGQDTDADDTPSWAKALIAKVESFEKANTQKTLKERFLSDKRVKDIPDFIRNGYIPTSEEEFEEKASELSTAYKEFAEKNKLQNYSGDNPPKGKHKEVGEKKISKEDAEKIASELV